MSANYTLVLGTKNFSSWSLRPWLAMKMAGIQFEETVIRLRNPETKKHIAKHSPSGKVPVLHIEEGGKRRTMWDTLAICEYLAERHADIAFWPKDFLRREEARCIVAEMHSGFENLRRTMPMDLAAHHPAPEIDEALGTEIDRIKFIWISALERFGQDGGFLFGEFSLADSFYAPVVTRFETYSIELPAIAREYAQRILSLTPMRDWKAAAIKELSESATVSEPEDSD
nr:MAG: glutathione S-transferase family protein [Hyphomicrobiales bacterium]